MGKPAIPNEELVKRHKEEITRLWAAIDDLLPEKFATIVKSYRDCANSGDIWDWARNASEQIVELAEPGAGEGIPSYAGDVRVYCPLCKRGSSSPYQEGFAYPGGLLRHLQGEGNSHECSVMHAARIMALDHVEDEFAQQLRRSTAQRVGSQTRKTRG